MVQPIPFQMPRTAIAQSAVDGSASHATFLSMTPRTSTSSQLRTPDWPL